MSNDSSEAFRKIPNDSETFGNVPHSPEDFRIVRNASARRENHSLTVREVARLFEAAGVSRTERSITNWCQPNKTGIARLDAYLDPNERKYFITPESVEAAIQEELARDKNANVDSVTADAGANRPASAGDAEVKTLQQEIVDLKIASRVKDQFIEYLRSEGEKFVQERQGYVEKLIQSSRQIGELETKLRQIEAPDAD